VASGVTFRLVPGLSARDRAATLAVLENAQWIYALGRYPKKQVLDDEIDVPWARLEDDPDETPDMLWTVAKKVTPKVLAEMRPLVSDTPEAAFLITPEPKKTAAKKTPKRTGPTKARTRGKIGGKNPRHRR